MQTIGQQYYYGLKLILIWHHFKCMNRICLINSNTLVIVVVILELHLYGEKREMSSYLRNTLIQIDQAVVI